jgi:hypothetical protein
MAMAFPSRMTEAGEYSARQLQSKESYLQEMLEHLSTLLSVKGKFLHHLDTVESEMIPASPARLAVPVLDLRPAFILAIKKQFFYFNQCKLFGQV